MLSSHEEEPGKCPPQPLPAGKPSHQVKTRFLKGAGNPHRGKHVSNVISQCLRILVLSCLETQSRNNTRLWQNSHRSEKNEKNKKSGT